MHSLNVEQITVEQLKTRLEQSTPKPVLLDVREPWEFAICHIDGSKLIPMRDLPNAIDQLDQDQETVVICHTGVRSLRVCLYLMNEGFEKVANLSGGVHAWATNIDSHMPTY
ncbi:rhodanese-like domain-containing protein [Kaarinaea lacus]